MTGNARDMVLTAINYINPGLKPEDVDEYVELAKMDIGLMTWSMYIEHVYGRNHSWAYNHISDPGLIRCAPDNDMTLRSHGGRDIMVRWQKRETSMAVLLRFADSIDKDLYKVLSTMGWNGLITLRRLMDAFPYREYRMTRGKITRIISKHIGNPEEIEWIIDALEWMIRDHPIIDGGMTEEWVDENIEYPFDFIQETYIHENWVTMEKYRSELSNLMLLVPEGGIHDSLLQDMNPDTKTGAGVPQIDSHNINRWMNVIGRITSLLGDDDMRTMMEAVSCVPETFNGFRVYPAIRKGSDMRNMTQLPSVSLEYAEHASAGRASFIRWMKWIRLQGEMNEDKVIAAYTDDRKIVNMPFGNPVITSFPKGMADWLDSGKLPTSLRFNGYVSLTMPTGFASRLQLPLTSG